MYDEFDAELLTDDFWRSKSIAELAWFLVTGKAGTVPASTDRDAFLKLHLTYASGFLDVLKCLIESTLVKSGVTDQSARLTDFSRVPILAALSRGGALKKVNANVRTWLETGAIPAKKPAPTIREELKKSCFTIRQERLKGIQLARKILMNRRLWSPELDVYKEEIFYLKEWKLVVRDFGKNERENRKRILRRAHSIYHRIEDDRQNNAGRNLSYLLHSSGKTPGIRVIYRKLADARYLNLDSAK